MQEWFCDYPDEPEQPAPFDDVAALSNAETEETEVVEELEE